MLEPGPSTGRTYQPGDKGRVGIKQQQGNWEKTVKCLLWQTDEYYNGEKRTSCLFARNIPVVIENHDSAISSGLVLRQGIRVTNQVGEPDRVHLLAEIAGEIEDTPIDGVILSPVVICDNEDKLILGGPDYIKLLLGSKNATKEEAQISARLPVQEFVQQVDVLEYIYCKAIHLPKDI